MNTKISINKVKHTMDFNLQREPHLKAENLIIKDEDKNGLPDILPQPPFRLLLCGFSGSGKSNLILNMITKFYRLPEGSTSAIGHSTEVPHYFDHIYYFSPSALNDMSIRSLVVRNPDLVQKNKLSIYETLDMELMSQLINGNDGSKKLIVIDDFAGNALLRNRLFINLIFRSRHNNNSIIFATQAYRSLEKALRNNCSDIILFTIANEHEARLLQEELGNNKHYGEEFIQLLSSIPKYEFIYKKVASNTFYRNFDEEI